MKRKLFYGLSFIAIFLFAGLGLMSCKKDNGNGPVMYRVTFDMQGGLPAEKEQLVAEGECAVEPANEPYKSNSIFLGWYTESGALFDFNTPIESDLTLVAKFVGTSEVFTITFDTQGGTPSVPSQQVKVQELASKPTVTPEKGDLICCGWFQDPEGGQPFDFNTPIVSDLTLYAQYSEPCVVTFEANAEWSVNKPVRVASGHTIARPGAPYPMKSGYIFSGWYTDEACTQKFDFETTPITSDITLYGGFMRRIKLTNEKLIAQTTGGQADIYDVPLTNNTLRDYDFGGTDLGIMWVTEPGQVGIFFGDTYGGSGQGPAADWRSNVLAFSSDDNLDDGLTFDRMVTYPGVDNFAKELIPKQINANSFTSIPTGAIRANGVDYCHYMNWIVGGGFEDQYFAEIYKSTNGGETWTKCPVKFSRDSKFFLVAFEKDPESDYIYMLGTYGSGNPGANPGSSSDAYTYRGSPVHLARIHETKMENQDEYEYWDGEKWVVGDESAAAVVLETYSGEASLMWHEKYKRWLYTGTGQSMFFAQAADLRGPWYTDSNMPLPANGGWGCYATMFHKLFNKTDDIYMLISYWQYYDVWLIKHTLAYV